MFYHLAAQSLVQKSYLDPTYTFTTNAIGTCNLLESLRYLKNKCNVVLITSDKSYKNLEILRGYKETDEFFVTILIAHRKIALNL